MSSRLEDQNGAARNIAESVASLPQSLVVDIEAEMSALEGRPVRIAQALPRSGLHSFSKINKFWKVVVGAEDYVKILHVKCVPGRRLRNQLNEYLSKRSLPVPKFFGVAEGDDLFASMWEFCEGRCDPTFDTYSEDEIRRLARAIALVGSRTADVGARVRLVEEVKWAEPVATRLLELLSQEAFQPLRPEIEFFARVESAAINAMNSFEAGTLTHNDLKAPNVIVMENGDIRIVDWDSATIGPHGASLRRFSKHGPNIENIAATAYVEAMAEHGTLLKVDDVRLVMRGQEVFWGIATGLNFDDPERIVAALRLARPAFEHLETAPATLSVAGSAKQTPKSIKAAAAQVARERADAAVLQFSTQIADLLKSRKSLVRSLAIETDKFVRTDRSLGQATKRVARLVRARNNLKAAADAELEQRKRAETALLQARTQAAELEQSLAMARNAFATETEKRTRADAAIVHARTQVDAIEKTLTAERRALTAEAKGRARADAAVAEAQTQVDILEKALAAEKRALTAEAKGRTRADAAVAEARNQVAALEKALAAEKSALAAEADGRMRAEAAVTRTKTQVDALENALAAEKSALAAEAEGRAHAEAAVVQAKTQIDALENALAAEKGALAAEVDGRARAEAAVVQAKTQIDALENALAAEKGALAAEVDGRARAEAAVVQAKTQVDALENALAAEKGALAAEVDGRARAEAAVVQAKTQVDALENALAAEKSALAAEANGRARAEAAVVKLRSQAASLMKSLASLKTSSADEAKRRERAGQAVIDARAQYVQLENARKALESSLAEESERGAALKNTLRETETKARRIEKQLKVEIAQLKLELTGARHGIVAMEQRLHSTRNSIPYKLGQILLDASRSWRSFVQTPRRLMSLRAQVVRTRKTQDHQDSGDKTPTLIEEILRTYADHGHQAASEIVLARSEGPTRASLLVQLAKMVIDTDPLAARDIGRRAYETDPRPGMAKWLAFLSYDCGFIEEAAALVAALPGDIKHRASERNKIEQIKGAARAKLQLPVIPARAEPAYEPIARSVLYVTSMALPFHTAGYTVRTQGLVEGLQAEGWSVTCVTRPGYPDDRADRLLDAVDTSHKVDGVSYLRLQGASAAKQGIDHYIRSAVEALEPIVRRSRASVIHAASNHVNALPALIVARKLGIPFVYEVRGLWEYTAASRNLGWETTERFALSKALETLVARSSDLVFTLTEGLARELRERGVETAKIALAPNSVNPVAFAPLAKDRDLVRQLDVERSDFTIVYVGSLLRYEGLDDLVQAVGILVSRGINAHLVIAGDGEARESLIHLAAKLGLATRVKLVGRIVREAARRYWSVADAVAFPRKPFPVCEIVSPIKPLEAMAMAIPMVVSDVTPLRELADDGRCALVHAAGDAEALADCLQRIARDPELGRRLGAAAREVAQADRSWTRTAGRIVAAYAKLTGRATDQPVREPAPLSVKPDTAVVSFVQPTSVEAPATPQVDRSAGPTIPPTRGVSPAKSATDQPAREPAPLLVKPDTAVVSFVQPTSVEAPTTPKVHRSAGPTIPPAPGVLPDKAPMPSGGRSVRPPPVAASAPKSVVKRPPQDKLPSPRPASRLPDIVPLPLNRNSMSEEEKASFHKGLDQAYEIGGSAAVRTYAERQAKGHSTIFRAYCLLNGGRCCQLRQDVPGLLDLARAATAVDGSASTVRGVCRAHYAAGDLATAVQAIDKLEKMIGRLTERDEKLAKEVRGQYSMFRAATSSVAQTPVENPVAGRSLYILHNSLPYSSAGYATRSHGIARGILAAGVDIRPYTRPGFPFDVNPALEGTVLPPESSIDGMVYRRLFENGRKGQTEYDYVLAGADIIERVLREECPAIVHAASNYVTAMPALIAARRVGLPFIYEVRGFWEITRSSREESFKTQPRYSLMRQYEALVAQQADAVVTLTGAMKDELAERGVDPAKITIAHNAVDPNRFVPTARDEALAERLGLVPGVPVIGYVGSFVHYEGLDDLVVACGQLARRGVDFRLLLVGDGSILDRIKELVEEHGIARQTLLTGRVPHEQVEAYYSLIDVCPFPRKPWEVCEKVSPLKPFEALAMEKAVVVSSVRALTEIIEDGSNGLVFEKGNVTSLAEVLDRCVADEALRTRLGKSGRQWIIDHRTWNRSGQVITQLYAQVVESRARRHALAAAGQ